MRTVEFSPHYYQQMVLDAPQRFILAVGGAQSGKTTVGMVWLLRALQLDLQNNWKGDYLIGVPNYKTWIQSTKVKFYEKFPPDWGAGQNLGWHEKDGYFMTSWGAHIYVRSTDDPNAVEGMTLRGAWLDEFGQMEPMVWINIQARVGALKAPCIMTTTPYLGKFWVKEMVYDRAAVKNQVAQAGDDLDAEICVVEWETADNPGFDKAEVERQRKLLSREMFDLRYRGKFSSPTGLVFKAFDRDLDIVEPFAIPAEWRRFGGIDFGFGSRTAVVCIAEEPPKVDKDGNRIGMPVFYLFSEFYEKGALLHRVASYILMQFLRRLLGDPRGAQEMAELAAHGVQHLGKADNAVEIGIERLNVLMEQHRLKIFRTCKQTLTEIGAYHYPSETEGKDAGSAPVKARDHAMDALRYAFSRELKNIYSPSRNEMKMLLNKRVGVRRSDFMNQEDPYTGYQ